MEEGHSRWCPSLCPSRDTIRFYLLWALIFLYMLAGAAIFSALETPTELKAQQHWQRQLEAFSHKHGVSLKDLSILLRYYEDANSAGIRMDRRRARWDFPGAFYFVGTVVSTIGFGMTAPSTTVGKVLLVIYGLIGCSATILFFNLFLERVITLLGLLMRWCHRRRTHNARLAVAGISSTRQEDGGEERSTEGGKEDWQPSVYYITLILFAAALVVTCGAAALYSAMEGWSYFESLYFCFVSFSTVGFGDLVSGQQERHEASLGYQMANCLLMVLGVCCTYSLFNATSVIIKQGLNWILNKLIRLRSCICHSRSHQRPWFVLCCNASEFLHSGDELQRGQQSRTVNIWDHSIVRPNFLTNPIGKCLCTDTTVETVCHRDTDMSASAEGAGQCRHMLPRENIIYVGPPL